MKKKFKVTASWLHVRTGPSTGYRILTAMKNGTEIIAYEEKDGWYKHDKIGEPGWSCGRYLMLIEDMDPPKVEDVKQDKPQDASDKPLDADQIKDASIVDDEGYDLSEDEIKGIFDRPKSSPGDPFKKMTFANAMPFQYTNITDIRPTNAEYGRTYLENIVGDGSFLFLIPGKPEFFDKITNSSKKKLADEFLNSIGGGGSHSSELEELAGDMNGRYYVFQSDYANYVGYVNAMCRSASIYLNLEKEFAKKRYDKAHGFDLGSNPITKDMFNDNYVCYYIDGNATSFSESVTSSTEASMLTGLVNKSSDMGREFRFVMGSMNAPSDEQLVDASVGKVESMVGSLMSTIGNAAPLIGQIGSMVRTVSYGGNVVMPDIWRDSQYGKSYSIEIKLVSPYGDHRSIFEHILVPMFQIFAMAFPRQIGRTGYTSPFIVRAFCKGWFNCDFGIVESLSIKKASQDGWSYDGLPTEIDISINLKDLYSTVAVSSADRGMEYLKNTEFLDMIGTYCGVNMSTPDFSRKMTMARYALTNKLTDVPIGAARRVSENIANKIQSLLK